MGLVFKNVMTAAVAAGMVLAVTGCGPSARELRPDPDSLVVGDRGVQCRDLREMAARLAPDLLASPVVVRSPTLVTVMMMDMANKTENERGRDMNIYLGQLTSLLNTN